MNHSIEKVKGFHFQGVCAGLKESGKKDLAIIYSEKKCNVSATYTKNEIIAEPLKLNKKQLKNNTAQAIVVNSGNANACTGKQGYKGAKAMAKKTSETLKISSKDVIVLSTGVIGQQLPLDKIIKGIHNCSEILDNTPEAANNTSEAILTTDTGTKKYSTEITRDNNTIHIAGIAKGSGMIHPNMGTMLAFIISDINIKPNLLNEAFREIVDNTFNMITVDGDTSTNDMAIIMTNGMAKNKEIKKKNSLYYLFKEKLHETCLELAKMIVKDGEGISKFIEYKVINASDEESAKRIIRTISTSSLVKTAIFGEDPNWGRIIAAAGRSGIKIKPENIDLFIGNFSLLQKGKPTQQYLNEVNKHLKKKEIYITLNLNEGESFAIGWGSDLTIDYVKFNAEYTT